MIREHEPLQTDASPGVVASAVSEVVSVEQASSTTKPTPPTATSLGWLTVPVSHPDRPALDLAAQLLSDRCARLGLSAHWRHRAMRDAGFMEVRASSRTDAESSVGPWATLDGALEELRRGEFTRAELESARRALRSAQRRRVGDQAARSRALAIGIAVHGDPAGMMQAEHVDEETSVAGVRTIIRRYLALGTLENSSGEPVADRESTRP